MGQIEKAHHFSRLGTSLLRLPSPEEAGLAQAFEAGEPFPNIVLDNVLAVGPEDIEQSFPDAEWPHWHAFQEHYQQNKRQGSAIETFPPLLKQIVQELSEPKFLRFLEQVTGIRALLVDPYLNGAGLHYSGPGGVLMPHIDFHMLRELGLFRRLNVIIYLNEEWQPDWGGCLKLYEKGKTQPTRTIVPEFGRMVIFRTDAKSVHGFPDPVVEGRWRKSIALYYYTSEEAAAFSGDTTTYWQEHGELGVRGKLSLSTYRWLLRFSTLFSRLAHAANPHMRAGQKSERKAARD